MKFKNLILTLALTILLLPLLIAQGEIINLVLDEGLPDFVAGERAIAEFSFDYPDVSGIYPEQEEYAQLVFIVNISSDNIDYPVWKGDFQLNGSMVSSGLFSRDEYVFDCSEDFELSCPYAPWIGEEVNGTFYCTNNDFLMINLGSDNDVVLDFKSHYALWPGDYSYSVGLFYPEDDFTHLIIEPSEPDGENDWYVSAPVFSLENDEALGLFYRWDSGEVFSYSVPFSLEDIVNPENDSAGILELNYWASFDCGLEGERTENLKVDLTNPVISDLHPANEEVVYDVPVISAYLDDVYQSNSGINKDSVFMILDDSKVEVEVVDVGDLDARVNYYVLNSLPKGWHEVFVYVEDNAGRASNLDWVFYVNETEAFNFVFYSLNESIYDSRRTIFNFTASKELEKIEYINWNDNNPRWKRLCKDCDEYGFTRMKTKTLDEGLNNFSIRGVDDFGSVVKVDFDFFIDSKKPRISRVLPRQNAVVNGSGFYIKYSEDNLKGVELFWNSTLILDCNESGRNKECWVDVNLSEHNNEIIEYWFRVSDNINVVDSKKTRIIVDTIAPKILNEVNDSFWYQGEGRSSRYIYFNISIEEKNLDEVEYIDYNDKNPHWRRICSSRLKDGSCIKKKSFRIGEHNIDLRVVDDAGNSVVKNIQFEV